MKWDWDMAWRMRKYERKALGKKRDWIRIVALGKGITRREWSNEEWGDYVDDTLECLEACGGEQAGVDFEWMWENDVDREEVKVGDEVVV